MKTVNFLEWDDLSKETKDKLLEEQSYKVLGRIEDGEGEYEGDLRKAIDRCIQRMNKAQTPWFLTETLRDDPVVKNYIAAEARDHLEGCLFYRFGKSVVDYREFSED